MIIRYILPIIALSIVIAIHELGHLILAKFYKVNVEVYSIGIGKKLFKHRFKGTEYALSLIPLGGYCKLKGGDINDPILEDGSIDTLNPLKKAIIFFAGPAFNFLLTFFLFTIIFLLPVHQNLPTTVIPVLGKNLPAEVGGVIKGDKIISINNNIINNFQDISENLTDSEINLIIERDSSRKNLVLTPQKSDGNNFIGVYPYIPLVVVNKAPSGLMPNDKIIRVDDQEVDDYLTLSKLITNEKQFNITYERDEKEYTIPYDLEKLNSTQFTSYFSYNIFESITLGFTKTFDMLRSIILMFTDLFKSGEVTESFSSPLRLVYEVGNNFDGVYRSNTLVVSLQYILTIMASISLTLGFINLWPIPVLDGGQILINLITALKGKPLNKTFIQAYQTTGLILILLLFTLGISNDIFFFGDLK